MLKGHDSVIDAINGPVVTVERAEPLAMLELVEVGDSRLTGEIIRLEGNRGAAQIYEITTGLRPGGPVVGTGHPLSVELGPGLIGTIYDGIQRPLAIMRQIEGAFIKRGVHVPALSRDRRWPFQPAVKVGEVVREGAILGRVPETDSIEHRVLLPPGLSGRISFIAAEWEYKVDEVIARIETPTGDRQVTMLQRWPVRRGRPYRERLEPSVPLITGQRIIDTFFPIAKGGTAAIPGGFGTGKTVTQHQLAKWSDAQVIVYIGCGERGNEMTEVLVDFPKLIDPRSGRPLMERTILVANTSNMPVAAREASIYTGITMAEYYRDMGYHVALMADSTSRWAEALREISGRLEEMPAEEGFPAYLPSRLAEFYERAGRVITLGGQEGSITTVGAVSPPGGAFTEPVTQNTQRFVRTFWALDRDLASARHFPAINWIESYSGYTDDVTPWWQGNMYDSWRSLRDAAMDVLHEDDRLQQVVRLVGADALPDEQRLTLETARIIREAFLQQNALDDVDTFSNPEKQVAMLRVIMHFYDRAKAIVARGVPVLTVRSLPVVERILRMGRSIPNDQIEHIGELIAAVDEQFSQVAKDYS
jgi:V/A-type H+-transporting ATPase subunit A